MYQKHYDATIYIMITGFLVHKHKSQNSILYATPTSPSRFPFGHFYLKCFVQLYFSRNKTAHASLETFSAE